MVSLLMYLTDPRRNNPLAGPAEPAPLPREELVATFIDVVRPETSALLVVLAAMVGDDDVLRADPAGTRGAPEAATGLARRSRRHRDQSGDALKGSVSQRAEMLMRNAGMAYTSYSLSLGSPDYLVSSRRRRIIGQRNRCRSD